MRGGREGRGEAEEEIYIKWADRTHIGGVTPLGVKGGGIGGEQQATPQRKVDST